MNYERWKKRKPVREILGDTEISEEIQFKIKKVLANRKVTNDRMKNLAYWAKYEVSGNYLTRFDKLLKHPRNDSSSKEIFILRYGVEEGMRRFNEKSNSCSQTKENMIKRHGKTKGLKKWDEYKDKISFANSEEGYIARYGEQEGKERFKKQCERNAGNLTLERKIELFGKDIGLEKYNKMKITQKEKNTLKQYIDKYGEDIGTQKYVKLCEIRSYKNSLAYYIEKYGEEDGIKRIKQVKNNGIHMNNYSKISIELFDKLKSFSTLYGKDEETILLESNENDVCGLWSIKPDFICGNKIIEFYGDRYHGNPYLFEDDDCCHPFNKVITAKEMRIRDEKRNSILKKRGYEVMIVWEYDFRKNKREVIENCKKFLS